MTSRGAAVLLPDPAGHVLDMLAANA